MITLTNTSSITRIGQTEHMEDKAKAITRPEVSREASEAAVALEAIAVSVEVKAVADMTHYLHLEELLHLQLTRLLVNKTHS
jgi:hypothetical protein